jgi:hypothetical protein
MFINMDDLEQDTVPSRSFYGKKKGRLPPPPQFSDGSEKSDDFESDSKKSIIPPNTV